MNEANRVTRKAKDRDGLYKRRGYWHFEYNDVNTGKRKSKSTNTKIYNDAMKTRAAFLELLKGSYDPTNDRLKLSEAADAYMAHRRIAVSAGTIRLEKERLRQLLRVFAASAGSDLRLKDINLKIVRLYQQTRITEGVGPRTVNMEGQLLRSIFEAS